MLSVPNLPDSRYHGLLTAVPRQLTTHDFEWAEQAYGVTFPREIREAFSLALPVSSGFYDWRTRDAASVVAIKKATEAPVKDIIRDPGNVYWSDYWGPEPTCKAEWEKAVCDRVLRAPRLIPLCGHRYAISAEKPNPVIYSIVGGDVVFYGRNLYRYLEHEFCGAPEDGEALSFITERSFWDELAIG